MMRCVPRSMRASTRCGVSALLALAVALVSCTDPVEDVSAPGPASATRAAEQAEAVRTRDRARGAPSHEDEGANEDVAGPDALGRPSAEALAAEVAAGRMDGGPATEAASLEGARTGEADVELPVSEQGPYVPPEIHASPIEGFQIIRFALAQDVIEREPVMISSSFERDGGPMHVFLEARNTTGADITLLVGFRPASSEVRGGGVSLTIPPSPRYRTRARGNTRRPAGEWICEVMDERQRVLVTQRFRITSARAADAP